VSSMTDDLQASGQEAIPATHRNCSNGIASQIERSRVGHERVADTLTASRTIAVRASLECATDSAEYSLFRFAGHGFRELSDHGGEVLVERRIYLVGGWISVGCHDLTHD